MGRFFKNMNTMNTMRNDEENQVKKAALSKILQVTSSTSAKYLTYSAAIIGLAALVPGIALPPELGVFASGIAVEAMGSILDRVANQNLTDEQIIQEVEKTISSISKELLSKDDFYHTFSHLNEKHRKLLKQNQTILNAINDVDLAIQNLEPILAAQEETNTKLDKIGEAVTSHFLTIEYKPSEVSGRQST
ncbi:MAG: hypothetical protein HXY24_13855 [Rubrivivax sp.]|nr:hypothetical protein [Rubrivivax sp.]